MRVLLFMICLFSTMLLPAQDFSYPVLKTSGKNVEEFTLPKWFIKDSAQGDLNGDKRPDLAVVLEYKDTIQELRPDGFENWGSPRILVVLLRSAKTAGYDLLVQNNTFITRYGEGGMSSDAYKKVRISKGILQLDVEFVRGGAAYKFRFQHNDLYLIGATTGGVSGGIVENFDVNFLTKKAKIEKGSLEEDKWQTKWVNISIKQLRRLREMKMMFDWEVVKNFPI